LDPVRNLVFGDEPLIDADVYAHYRQVHQRVMSRVAPVATSSAWAFFAVAAVANGAPRWMLVDGERCVTDLQEISVLLRALLAEDPPDRPFDHHASDALNRALSVATSAERALLPRRMQRALEQMAEVTTEWGRQAQRQGDEIDAQRWFDLRNLTASEAPSVDPYRIAEAWLRLIEPAFDRFRLANRKARYVLLRDVKPDLVANRMAYDEVAAAFSHLPAAAPLDERVSACILGVAEHQ
jgi:hypothetical protein